jgi:hypothetical protein
MSHVGLATQLKLDMEHTRLVPEAGTPNPIHTPFTGRQFTGERTLKPHIRNQQRRELRGRALAEYF